MPFTSFSRHNDDDEPTNHMASADYPELEQILDERPPPERAFMRTTAAKQVEDAKCSLCNINPATRDAGGTTVCDSCAQNQLGIPLGNQPGSQFGQSYASLNKCARCEGSGKEQFNSDSCYDCGGLGKIATPNEDRDWDLTPEERDELDKGVVREAGFFTDLFKPKFKPDSKHQPGMENAWSYDWCRFRKNSHCFFPKELDAEATKKAGYAVWVPQDRGLCPRVKWMEQMACSISQPGPHSGDKNSLTDATVPWDKGGQHGGKPSNILLQHIGSIDISTEASIDKVASYWDVQQKAKRLRSDGAVKLLETPQEGLPYIYAQVQGDHGPHHLVIERNGHKIASWICDCTWGEFGPDGIYAQMRAPDSPYKNRKCSHVLAASYELQARSMNGNTPYTGNLQAKSGINPDETELKNERVSPFVVEDNSGEQHTIIHIDDDILISDGGFVLGVEEIHHPDYDPHSGLDFKGTNSD